MLKIKIHRGSHQIGGCATELEYNGERILIDLGSNLPGTDAKISDDELLDSVFGVNRDRQFDAILFSHYHGDHVGQYKSVPNGILMYIGPVAKDIMKLIASYTEKDNREQNNDLLEHLEVYEKGKPIPGLKEFRIIPLSTDHSALDAYMFFIEVCGKRILFTGDFREHGVANEKGQLWKTIDKYVGKTVDILMTEGTMLSRVEEHHKNEIQTEQQLGKRAGELFREKKYNFVLVSSTNLDSVMEFYHNTPKDKLFLCDTYQAKVIMTAVLHMYKYYAMYQGKKENDNFTKMIYIYGNITMEDYAWLNSVARAIKEEGYPSIFFKLFKASQKNLEDGFVMLVRQNRFFEKNGLNAFEKMICKYRDTAPNDTQFIYSMWEGYLEGNTVDENIVRITGGRKSVIPLHTSGHAYVETIAKLMGKINPKMVIPMHTQMADCFDEFKEFAEWKDCVYKLQDGEELYIKE